MLIGNTETLLKSYGLQIYQVEPKEDIPGSFWGEPEAGLIGSTLYLRDDTPLHSALHEACHYICMDSSRRQSLHTNAGGSDIEENAVCYLQVLIAGLVEGYSCNEMFIDMDDWGYSFRLGSAKTWFEQDAEDAQSFLRQHRLIGKNDLVCIGQLR